MKVRVQSPQHVSRRRNNPKGRSAAKPATSRIYDGSVQCMLDRILRRIEIEMYDMHLCSLRVRSLFRSEI